MLSKLFGWISSPGTESKETTSEKVSPHSIETTKPTTPPPPVPEKTKSLADHLKTNGPSTLKKVPVDTISTADGTIIPKALTSAFNQPQKDKKPFTYFTGGQAPDLSSHPSPKTVRKENSSYTNGPVVPKVLPIVSDEELRFEEQRIKTPSPTSEMPTLTHLQYNSPLPIYSKGNIRQEINRATGQPQSSSAPFNIQHSGAYRVLHTENRMPENHSARLDEPSSDDYPRYRGFVNPNIQSPSFKRLQYVAGLHSDDEEAVEVPASSVRNEEVVVRSRSRGVSFGDEEREENRPTFVHSDEPSVHLTYRPVSASSTSEMPSAGYQGGPNWSSDGPPIAQYDPSADYDDRGRTPDPGFMAKIAEAERPRVPAPVVPAWAKKAEAKHQKWTGYTGGHEAEQRRVHHEPMSHHRTPSPVRSFQQPAVTAVRMAPPPAQPYVQPYVQRQPQYKTFNVVTERPRAKSTEPQRHHGADKEWMKPYIAPNVLEARFPPGSGRTSTSPMFRSYTDVNRSHDVPAFGQYFGPQGHSHASRTTSTYSRRSDSSRPKTPTYKITTTYLPQSQRREVYTTPVTTVATREPSWSRQHETTSSSRLWQHESEARRREIEMEQEAHRRAASSHPSHGTVVQWQPKPSDRSVSTYTSKSGPEVTQKWQDASGASTKTQSQGSYVDKDGNTVNYVKEVYTTSDPGKEFSMLTSEEKKVLEEPLQPGVISRHITTKYYKKSTYTSTSTTSTNQSPPSVSYPRRLQIGPGESQY